MMTVGIQDQESRVVADEVKMQVRVMGTGRPIVLVGGGLTGWMSWQPHAERLAATRTVALLQPLNVQFGLEDRPLPASYGPTTESTALKAALDDMEWYEPVDVVGWSYGAFISLDFALEHPERIRSLTLIEPPAAWALPENGVSDPGISVLQELHIGSDVTESELEQILPAIGLVPDGQNPRDLPQWPVWVEHRRSFRAFLVPIEHKDDPARLKRFDRPVLLVAGTDTAPFERRIQRALAALLPRARSLEMPGGHDRIRHARRGNACDLRARDVGGPPELDFHDASPGESRYHPRDGSSRTRHER